MKIAFWIFILILIYILIAYFQGTTSVLSAFGGMINNSILYLQGRDSAGNLANYPH